MKGAAKASDAQVADVLPGKVAGEQSWRFEASEADFRFAVLHPDIAVALVETPFHFSGTAERACQGELRGVRIEWHPLRTAEPAQTQYSVLVKLQAAFSPFCPAWPPRSQRRVSVPSSPGQCPLLSSLRPMDLPVAPAHPSAVVRSAPGAGLQLRSRSGAACSGNSRGIVRFASLT